ncbi:MAG: tRNA (adenosine(37)-N6)-threonylcarbamoyltransferase complex transferase subunit TsaD [Candidatus Yanofskybacteria bacterium RIFCSPHIGHO2_01_FULL_44_110b]|nr:MAG: tRNA (adenosine(37)-N6)-threonylcarbamoyltransferase complex transferase subunit TsaD [Candidatus Yanofskybacteria bacterium RIFCSPHIGHO2_01_FULL_44_110b]
MLGIETSCDETAMAVLDAGKNGFNVLSNVVSSQVKMHAKFGGVVPNLAAREHVKNISHVFNLALKEAGIKNFQSEIDLIAVTRGPGLGPALLVGLMFAKTLAWKYGEKIIGINHLEGHIYSNWLNGGNIKFPALNLIVSGGHTELVLMKNYGKYEIVGETLDDAVGEAFDKVARLLDLGYPGGPVVSKMAESGDPAKYALPRPMIKSKDFNFSYSGLKTAVLYLLKDLNAKKIKFRKEDICASFQNAAIDVLLQKTQAAGRKYSIKALCLSGGVSANKMLREKLSHIAVKNGWQYSQPEMRYTTDNAAMIAVAGYFESLKKTKRQLSWQSVEMDANLGF